MASTGDLRGEMLGMRGSKESMGVILSEFLQRQQQQEAPRAQDRAEEEDVKMFMSMSDSLAGVKSPFPQIVSLMCLAHPNRNDVESDERRVIFI